MKHFYKCSVCGNIAEFEDFSGYVPVCCGKRMQELIPCDSDGAKEKHVPVYKQDGCKLEIAVGSELHPATTEHHICWIALETDKGFYKRYLTPTEDPKAVFHLCDCEKIVAIYAYCNLHGLWVTVV